MIAWARLIRLPNLPSPLADIALGALAAGWPADPLPVVFLALASMAIYAAGMVLNDYFDVSEDCLQRPERPLPRGDISRRDAGIAGHLLLGAGLVFATVSGRFLGGDDPTPGRVAMGLIATVWVYNARAKRTIMGPFVMGACRGLNVLLGSSVAGESGLSAAWLPSAACFLYIAGLTWFARNDGGRSQRWQLAASAAVVAVSLGLTAWTLAVRGNWVPVAAVVGLVAFLGQRVSRALRNPQPASVRPAVGRLLLGYIPFDAAWAAGLAGPAGWGILILMPVMVGLRRLMAARLT
ncbi:MAG: UbiA family prenyltransferase [Planctomycetota bacterium]